MVYCTKCGSQNPDDARVCTQCGASLYAFEAERVRRQEPECFGIEKIPRAGTVIGLVLGIFIIVAGLLWFLKEAYIIPRWVEIWPFALIMFGILIIIGAFYGMRRT